MSHSDARRAPNKLLKLETSLQQDYQRIQRYIRIFTKALKFDNGLIYVDYKFHDGLGRVNKRVHYTSLQEANVHIKETAELVNASRNTILQRHLQEDTTNEPRDISSEELQQEIDLENFLANAHNIDKTKFAKPHPTAPVFVEEEPKQEERRTGFGQKYLPIYVEEEPKQFNFDFNPQQRTNPEEESKTPIVLSNPFGYPNGHPDDALDAKMENLDISAE